MKKLVLVVCGLMVVAVAPAKAAQQASNATASNDPQVASGYQAGRVSLTDENDKFASPDDRHYTQGMKLSYMQSADASDDARTCDWSGVGFSWGENGTCKRRYDWTLIGQSIFTPKNISAPTPTTKDRPYGAWLYTGVSVLDETKHDSHSTLDNDEVQLGVIGPFALGGLTQNNFHQFIGVNAARGWQNEIHNEPGIVLTHERKWRFEAPMSNYFSVDAIPEVGATLGNIFTYGEAGGLVRFGHNLTSDYGPSRVRPSLSGTGWYDRAALHDNMGWYLFAGTQGRAVARNIFLDGNSFQNSRYVDKKPLVADFTGGASLLWPGIRVDFTVTERTKEFYGQRGENDRFGGISVSFSL